MPLPTQTPRQTIEPTAAPSLVSAHWEPAGTMATPLRERHAVLLGDGRVLVVGSDFDSGAPKAALWDPSTGAWHATETLNKARSEFAAVPLANGGVLVTGGTNDTEQSYSSTYIYDPGPGHETWAKSGLLGTARSAPSAAVLPDGRVLVAGGYFHVKASYGRIAAPRAEFASYQLASFGEIASTGPRLADIDPPNIGAALATAELFDPAMGEWSATGPMAYARFDAAAVTLADGRVLIVGSASGQYGGVKVDGRAERNAEIFDPKTARFSLAGRLPDIDRGALEKQGAKGANPVPDEDPDTSDVGTLVALKDGGAVLIGWAGWWKHVGDITRSFRFDPKTNRWSEIGQTWISVGEPTAVVLETPGVRNLAGAIAARLADGRVLVAGGAGATGNGTSLGSHAVTGTSAELYDPTADRWSPVPPIPEARVAGAAVVLADGSVLLAGGYRVEPTETVELTSAVRFVPPG